MSIRKITLQFNVNRRLIQFILFPERREKNLQDRQRRGGSKAYYDKDRHKKSIKETRRYKQSLYKKRLINLK